VKLHRQKNLGLIIETKEIIKESCINNFIKQFVHCINDIHGNKGLIIDVKESLKNQVSVLVQRNLYVA